MTRDLPDLPDWGQEHRFPLVAMESREGYRYLVFNLLDGDLEVLRVNPSHFQQVPRHPTEVQDCEWLAQLLEQG